jgi:uncharacterized protein
VRYTWDQAKSDANRKKHGVSFEEAVSVFADPLALILDDDVHPQRSTLIGLSDRKRTLFTVFIEHDESQTRIISARCASNHERRRYEEGE